MEFVGAAKEAAILGLPINLFLPVWEKETALRELKDKNFPHDQLRATGNPVNNSQEDELELPERLAQQANEIVHLKSSLVELKSELCHLRSDLSQSQQILETTSASLKDQQKHSLQTVITSVVAMRSDLDTLRSDMTTELQSLSMKLDPILNMKEKIEAALKTFSNNHIKCSPTPLDSLGLKSVISHGMDEDRHESSVDNPINGKVKGIFNEMNIRKVRQEKSSPKSDAKTTTNHNQSCATREHDHQVSMSENTKFAAAKPGDVEGHLFSFNTNLIIGAADSLSQNDPQKLGAPSSVPPSDSTVVKMNCQNAAVITSLTMTSTSSPTPCFKPPAPTPCFKPPAPTPCFKPPAHTPCFKPPAPTSCLKPPAPTSCLKPPAPTSCLKPPAPIPCLKPRKVIKKRRNADGTLAKPRVGKKAEVNDAVDRSVQTEAGEVQVLLQPRLLFMPAGGASFSIPSTHSFYDGNGDFYTELYFILGSPCKARLRMRLAEHGRLAVTALLSLEGTKALKSPLYISGVGYISAKVSGGGGYSQIFEFPKYTISSTHAENEVSLEALVFLQTHRTSYKNITYKKLVAMRYDMNRDLRFSWNLKCS